MAAQGNKATHWADNYAARVVAERSRVHAQNEYYTCASGITPSGTIHIGNFREIITVDLVARALRDLGHPVRFIYSWDDWDPFRKVPGNIPDPQSFEQHLRLPITKVPDPWGESESYARAHERRIERVLPELGIEPEYIYQAQRYERGDYAHGIRTALSHRHDIRAILDKHRTTPLPEGWWPVTVFSRFNGRDNTTVLEWDGEWNLTYRCDDTGNSETVDIRSADCLKLPWRVDWPMRWQYERVDFEPAGKEHHSAGGSFDTAREIVKEVYGYEAPVSFKYDFLSIKGAGGKISSSSGEVIAIDDVLEVYQPEVVRYLFAGTRPNAEFAISFDLDVIKIYEDYDRCERVYYGVEQVGEKKRVKESRIYELSQVDVSRLPRSGATPPGSDPGESGDSGSTPGELRQPRRVPFRHLCNLLLITAGNIEPALDRFGGLEGADRERGRARARRAWYWIEHYAPEDFRFTLRSSSDTPIALEHTYRAALLSLAAEIERNFEAHDEKSLQTLVYDIARANGLEPADFFTVLYRVLIGKEKGPRLAGFLNTLGRETVLDIFSPYRE